MGLEGSILLVDNLLRKGQYNHVLCEEQQFGKRNREIQQVTETVPEPEDEESAADETNFVPVFKVDKCAVKYTRASGHDLAKQSASRLFVSNKSETAENFTKLGLEKLDLIRKS